MSRIAPAASGPAATVLSVIGEAVGLLVQVALVWLGIELYFPSDPDVDVLLVVLWCALATAYVLGTIVGMNVVVRLDRPDPPVVRVVVGHPLTRLLSTVFTFAASMLGLREAVGVIADIGTESVDPVNEVLAIWTMLLSWSIFHWGFARIYYSRWHRAPEPPLVFPGTERPRLTDFVYFSFTNATNFSVSDVQVVSSRLRWTVMWHTTFSFFFNALIIALAMNVISKGDLFALLLG